MGHGRSSTDQTGARSPEHGHRTALPRRDRPSSDKGAQYTLLAFGKRFREMGVLPSTGSTGNCYDNAMAESFFATLECELIDRRTFQTQAEARMAIFEFIEGWYNTHRRHSALGYVSPNDFERATAGTSRENNSGPHDRVDSKALQMGKSEVRNYPLGLPSTLVWGRSLVPPAIAPSVLVATALNRPLGVTPV